MKIFGRYLVSQIMVEVLKLSIMHSKGGRLDCRRVEGNVLGIAQCAVDCC